MGVLTVLLRASVEPLLSRLPTPESRRFAAAFTRGTLEVELYTDDLTVWVVFYGSEGGERP